MEAKGKFILLELNEFQNWIKIQDISRKINLIQLHHCFIPNYKNFKNDNHFKLCEAMERAHLERGFSEIAQNLTIFPDGKIAICRSFNKIPAGIKGANTNGIAIENVGNFDIGKDQMTNVQRQSITEIVKSLLNHFNLQPNEKSVVYHHWYDLNTGKRIATEGTGVTKSCPGTNFFGGNKVVDFKNNLLPLLEFLT